MVADTKRTIFFRARDQTPFQLRYYRQYTLLLPFSLGSQQAQLRTLSSSQSIHVLGHAQFHHLFLLYN